MPKHPREPQLRNLALYCHDAYQLFTGKIPGRGPRPSSGAREQSQVGPCSPIGDILYTVRDCSGVTSIPDSAISREK